MTEIKILGARGSLPVSGKQYMKYGGATACVMLKFDEEMLLLDAGSGILNLPQEVWKGRTLHIFISHFHLDHMMGLLLSSILYTPGQKVHFYTACENADFLEILDGMMQKPYWPVDSKSFFADITCHTVPRERMVIPGLETSVEPFEVYHPDQTFAYRFERNGKSVVYATDAEFTLSNKVEAKKYQDFCVFANRADAVILDAQYTKEEFENKRGFGHTSMDLAVQLLEDAEVKNGFLFHHAPNRTDQEMEQLEAKLSAGKPHIVFAREGETYQL